MLHPPKTSEPIPGYVTKERIGVGGYGEVWSAQAPGGLTKAIKFVYGYFDDARASRELKALDRIKQVRHPFLLSLERFEVVDGQLVIVTELADMSLKDRFEQLKQQGAVGIPRDELLNYLRDAADALDYMSSNFSLQHLDVKPENLLLVGGRVKVADFGLVKDLHDVTASMMGGLTPIYAAPEVFDDRPSQRSDQYSLAIVYQEMLTGNLPFPGRTPAQLASQHLHASPRLSSLPETDQPVIATALAKDPAQRFVNCRSMIDALLGQVTRSAAPEGKPTGTFATNDTTAIKSAASKTDPDGEHRLKPDAPSSATQVLDAASPPLSESRCAALARLQAAAEPVEELPPLDVSLLAADLRPTLIVGIGGTASRVLRGLRRKLHDRFGATAALQSLPLLLLDTDTKALYQATDIGSDNALSDHEVLPLPLRGAHDYTTDSRNILTWLSRRWLYNIPRSLQTEGRRPLGRLALVDHASQVITRMREAIAAMCSEEAIAASSQIAGQPFKADAPRIIVVASISGGTGGGMVLDVTYAAGELLAQTKLPEASVCTLLLHSTDRNSTAAELATANAFACLTELQHYREAGYRPGAASCGLPAPSGAAVLGPTYFVPLGHDLTDQKLAEATDRVAGYLDLSLATKAGAALDKCRSLVPRDSEDVTLHGFGHASIGTLQTSLPVVATELVCQGVVDFWRGANQGRRDSRLRGPLVDLAAERAKNSGEELPKIDQHVAELQISVPRLRELVGEILDKELGGDADTVFARVRSKIDGSPQSGPLSRAMRLQQAIRVLFDPPQVGDDGLKLPTPPLLIAMERGLKHLATPRGEAIRDWILKFVELPASRVGGAARARDAYAALLRELTEDATRLVKDTQQNLQALEQSVMVIDKTPPPRTIFGTRRVDQKRVAEIDGLLLLVVRLRLQELTVQGVVKLLRLLSASVASAGDQIKDLQRELGQWSGTFDADWPWDEESPEPQNVGEEVQRFVGERLRERLAELARRVDDQVQSQFVEAQGGLRTVCQKADALRPKMLEALRASARAEVLAALSAIPLDEPLLGQRAEAEGLERLNACIATARPPLVDCGGGQRLLAIVPQSGNSGPLQETISAKLDPPATILAGTEADLVLVFEQQELSLPHVAARLIEGRKDFVEIASRLHTRVDVSWSELPLPGQSQPVAAAH